MGKPFKITSDGVPAARPAAQPGPTATEVMDHARREGETVEDAIVETRVPDADNVHGKVETGTERGEGHVQSPGWKVGIPWPAAQVGPKPFKVG